MKNVLIVGYGVVGHNLAKELEKLNPDIYDKFKTENNTKRDIVYDFAFICVDTPFNDKGDCDISAVIDALNETKAKVIVIKSTILPKTTKMLQERFKDCKILFSPEYYGGTQHCNNFEFAFTIVGGDKEYGTKVVQLLQNVYDARHRFFLTDSTTAELVKYMENSYLATKVSFCVSFFEMAKELGVNYEELRELFIQDVRVNPSHTFVYEDHPYWDTHCLNKDVPAIANYMDSPFLKSVVEYNKAQKNKYKNL